MNSTSLLRASLLPALLLAAACGEKGVLPDVGAAADTGPGADAEEPRDLGPPPDLGFDDAGQPIFPDAEEPVDLGPPPDAGPPPTCGTPANAAMSFFVTEQGNLSGNFGGLGGADARCTTMAVAAGVAGKTWRAYLSAENDATFGRVDAKDRIGDGPFTNYAGTSIGTNTSIHADGIVSTLILTECGRTVVFNADDREGDPGAHDIFTGSKPDGTLDRLPDSNGLPNGPGATCRDWTSASPDDKAMIGHSDWNGPDDGWNFGHYTIGCSEDTLRPTGANGRIYCFAID